MNLRTLSIPPLLAMLAACSGFTTDSVEKDPAMAESSIYSFEAESLTGEAAPLQAYIGQVTLIVNTASKCGYTSQYKDLQDLQTTYAEQGFSVLGFPSGDFGGQEFETAGEIRAFCDSEFGVSFPLFAKTQVEEGNDQSPIYNFLGKASGSLPAWNFGKYLVDREGRVLAFYASQVNPMGQELRAAIEAALEQI
jgi:glutathione peroxidase